MTPDSALAGGLPAAARATLDAAARVIAPAAFDAPDGGAAFRADLAAVVSRMPPRIRADLTLALRLLGSPIAVCLTTGRPRRFARLAPDRAARMLRAWERSPVAPLRTVCQAVRRLVLATYYARPEVSRAIGYLGPLHERGVRLSWEGPAAAPATSGATNEPITRVARDGAAPLVAGRDLVRASAAPGPAAARAPAPGAGRVACTAPGTLWSGADLATDIHLTADVIVIGSGAGGAVAAARFAEAGRDVIVLEEGAHLPPGAFTEREAEMTERLYAERGMRATDDQGVMMLQGRSLGGGTTVNWMIMIRTPDHVLDEWADEHGARDLAPAAMRPVFERIEREVHAAPVPDDAHSPNNRLLLDGANALGWRAAAGRINARGCVRAGFCGQGCRYGAKQGAAQVWLPRALAAGARLFTDVRADRVELVERGGPRPRKRVTADLLDPATGAPRGRLTAEAPIVVCAAGAVGTPVLLQRSGLGGGGVGRFLRLHPTTAVVGCYDREIYAAAGIPLSVVCDEFLRRDGDGYGFWLECPPFHPSLGAVALPGFGAAHAAVMSGFSRMGAFIALVRDGADRAASSGDVTLRRDGRVRLRYRLAPRDARTMADAIEAAARVHLAAGAREVVTLHTDPPRITSDRDLPALRHRSLAPNHCALFSAHVNGTCRLGRDPDTSGATPDGEHHGVRGLLVCDGSLLPTAPGVNPQETIMAIATIVAERAM